MRSEFRDKLWYKIVLIRLDLSREQLCDLMILQLSFLLDVSFDEYVGI